MESMCKTNQSRAALAIQLSTLICLQLGCGVGKDAENRNLPNTSDSGGLSIVPNASSSGAAGFTARRTLLFRLGIRGADGLFLGCWNCLEEDPDSVLNAFGIYGSNYSSASLRNPNGPGSPYAPNGACNPYAPEGPTLFLMSGSLPPGRPLGFGFLSLNAYAPGGICNPVARFYNPADCNKLKFLCSGSSN